MKASRVMVLAAAITWGVAHAQQTAPVFAEPDLSEGGVRALAAGCAMCHGTEGRPVAGSSFPTLAGRPARDFIAAMNDFKRDKRAATVMHQIAKGYGDAEIAALAEYFAKRVP